MSYASSGALPILNYGAVALKSPTITSQLEPKTDAEALREIYGARQTSPAEEPETPAPLVAPPRPNYLLWGGLALVAAGGVYFLFFRKKGKKS